mgnify:FL=1
MKNSILKNIFYITMLFLFIHSMYPWFTFEYENAYLSLGALGITAFVGFQTKIFQRNKSSIIVSILFLCLYLWLSKYSNIFGSLELIIQWLILCYIVSLKYEYKIQLIEFITKWFAILMSISLGAYILFLSGVSFPGTIVEYQQYFMDNHYFFLQKELFRFQSVFLEPGHMTMGLAPLLFINKYNLKNRYVLILFIAQMLSLSLAGYMMMMIGYSVLFLFDKQSKKSKFISVLLSAILICSVAIFMQNSFENNVFDDLIFRRMQFDNGHFVGDNRSSVYLDRQFEDVVSSSDILTGRYFNAEMSEKGVAGYKKFIVQYGLIGCVLLILSFFSTYKLLIYKHRRNAFLLVIMILLLLLQNAYPTWWCIVIATICGTTFMQNKEISNTLAK